MSECDILFIKIQSGLNMTVGVTYASSSAHINFNSLNNIFKSILRLLLAAISMQNTDLGIISNNKRGVLCNLYTIIYL